MLSHSTFQAHMTWQVLLFALHRVPTCFPLVIVTGAADHLVYSLDSFASYKLVQSLFFNLPTGQQVPVQCVGIVHRTPSLTVFYALYVLTFSFSLIFAS